MKKICISASISCCLLFFMFVNDINAQDNYDHSIGMRGGNPSALTYKTFLQRYTGYEIIFGANFSDEKVSITGTGLYQYNHPIGTYTNLYGGAGMTLGYGQKFIWNIDLMLGIEYTFNNFPMNISFDYKPMYAILNRNLGKNGFGLYELGISARYTFVIR